MGKSMIVIYSGLNELMVRIVLGTVSPMVLDVTVMLGLTPLPCIVTVTFVFDPPLPHNDSAMNYYLLFTLHGHH